MLGFRDFGSGFRPKEGSPILRKAGASGDPDNTWGILGG